MTLSYQFGMEGNICFTFSFALFVFRYVLLSSDCVFILKMYWGMGSQDCKYAIMSDREILAWSRSTT